MLWPVLHQQFCGDSLVFSYFVFPWLHIYPLGLLAFWPATHCRTLVIGSWLFIKFVSWLKAFEGILTHLVWWHGLNSKYPSVVVALLETSSVRQSRHSCYFSLKSSYPMAGCQCYSLSLCLDHHVCGRQDCSWSNGTHTVLNRGPHLGPSGPLSHLENVINKAEEQNSHQRFPAFLQGSESHFISFLNLKGSLKNIPCWLFQVFLSLDFFFKTNR